MATTVAEFRIRFPEFSDPVEYPDERIQLFLDDAVCFIGTDENRWCNKYDLAVCYYAAHLLSVASGSESDDSSSKSGPISGYAAGGVSVSRASTSNQYSQPDDFLMTTVYGQQFLAIRNGCIPGVRVTGVPC